jgi:hypothetical protein
MSTRLLFAKKIKYLDLDFNNFLLFPMIAITLFSNDNIAQCRNFESIKLYNFKYLITILNILKFNLKIKLFECLRIFCNLIINLIQWFSLVKENSDFGFFKNTSFSYLYKSVFESNLKYRKHLANPFRFFF